MSAQLLKDTINYERLIGEGTGQTMLSQDLVLSDRSPEIGKILNINGKVNIISAETSEEKVIVDGKMTIDVFYSSHDEGKGIYKLSSSNNFTQNISLPQSDSGMRSVTNAKIDHIEYEIVSNKKIKVNSIINLDSMVYSGESIEVVVDMKGDDIQLLRDNLELSEYLGEDKIQSIVKLNVNIPEDKEEVSSVLNSDITVNRKEVIISDGKIAINATGVARIMYDTSTEDVCNVDEEFSFESEIEMEGINSDSKCDIGFKIIDVYDSILENDVGERREIEIEAVIDVSAKSYGKKNIQSIVDAYAPDEGYEFEKVTVKALNFFGEGSDSQTIKERVNLEEDDCPVEEIKCVSINPIVTDLKVIEDKVIGEGILEANILYLTSEEEGCIVNFEEEIPFKTTVDVKGAKPDMAAKMEVNIEHISFDKISDKEMDLKIILNAEAKLSQKSSLELIQDVIEVDLAESIKNMPTFTIYCIQKGDSLWKIAKKYVTTVENIVSVNNIEDPNNIKIGDKIIIPKKTFIA